MSLKQRQGLIDREHRKLSLVRQCTLLGLSRAWLYYQPTTPRAGDLELMALMDRQYLNTPFYGSRKMQAWLRGQGHIVGRNKVRRLMRLMGLEAIYRRPNTSKPAPGHRIYPYLLKGVEINRVNQVWSADITYIPMAQGFLYLVAIMDWHSRKVISWRLSNTMDVDFCVEALDQALSQGRPEIFNTDQGSQFTSEAFTGMLLEQGIQVSMDGKGRYLDNSAPRRRKEEAVMETPTRSSLASQEMRVGPSDSGYRPRVQTTGCCAGPMTGVVSETEKAG
jgi:putative transposase